MPAHTIPLERRFLSKVDNTAGPNACWVWNGRVDRNGYGRIWSGRPLCKTIGAHRYAYERHHGVEIPDNMCVCHSCDNPRCCNPNHLWLGTVDENNKDRTAKGRSASGDRNGTRMHPERLARGDRNGTRRYPERLLRGDENGSRKHPERLVRGEANHKAKLTAGDVVAIRQAYDSGQMDQSQLAKLYGVIQPHISRIVLRQSWRHI